MRLTVVSSFEWIVNLVVVTDDIETSITFTDFTELLLRVLLRHQLPITNELLLLTIELEEWVWGLVLDVRIEKLNTLELFLGH